MSASLVGSEMCIRDRPPNRSRYCPKYELAQKVTTSQDHSAGAASCAIPVSYTHLTLPTICSV
eukprot:8779063-Alexandrium_andersonii.AAC.1